MIIIFIKITFSIEMCQFEHVRLMLKYSDERDKRKAKRYMTTSKSADDRMKS